MRNAFMCSLCHKGILGGGLSLEPEAIVFRTQKLTVDKKYRNLVLPLKEIKEVTWQQIFFPVATFHMENGGNYKMIIFNKARFCKCYKEHCSH